jgi:hypothetical protein
MSWMAGKMFYEKANFLGSTGAFMAIRNAFEILLKTSETQRTHYCGKSEP